jgi:CheY-like chemotaxis protein
VLVLDDNADARELTSMALLGAGAQVIEAESVAEALTVLQITRVDVIVSDIGMPSEDGYAFLRAVRSDVTRPRVPALALTGFARAEDRARAIAAGFDDHVAKPMDPDDLLRRVAALARDARGRRD